MALVSCMDCGREVSTRATNCPNCGAPVAASEPPLERKKEKPGPSPLRHLFSGVVCSAIGIALYLWAKEHSPYANFATKLSRLDGYVLKEQAYLMVIAIAALFGLGGAAEVAFALVQAGGRRG